LKQTLEVLALRWQWDRTLPSRSPSVAGTLGRTLHTKSHWDNSPDNCSVSL